MGSDQLTSVIGPPTMVGEYGRWWRTRFAHSQHCLPIPNGFWSHCSAWGIFTLSAGMQSQNRWGEGDKHNILQLCLLASKGWLPYCDVYSISAAPTRLCCNGEGKGTCLFPEGPYFCTSHNPGHCVRAADQLLTDTALAGAQLPLWPLSLSPSHPAPLLVSICPPSVVPMSQTLRCTC